MLPPRRPRGGGERGESECLAEKLPRNAQQYQHDHR